MKLEHSARLEVPRERVWAILVDVPRAALLVPGLGPVEPIAADRYRGALRVQVGPMRLELAGEVAMTSRDDRAGTATMRLDAGDRRLGGSLKATLDLTLTAVGPAATDLRMVTDAQLLGRIGELGQPVIRRKADQLMSQFVANLVREAVG